MRSVAAGVQEQPQKHNCKKDLDWNTEEPVQIKTYTAETVKHAGGSGSTGPDWAINLMEKVRSESCIMVS